ncbi:MAG: hypothetical protein HY299_15790 [Verrucomicrobia bacterium]|nr:hypothetical protein [Verrucomicrobiota bacterium]
MDDKKNPPAAPELNKSKGFPIWTALIALLVVALVGIASLVAILYYTRSDKARLERQMAEMQVKQEQAKINEKKAADDTKLALARNKQDEVIAQARSATNVLSQLLADVRALNSAAETLKSNDAGKLVAVYPDLVAQARRFYQTELPAVSADTDVVTKLESIRRIELQVAEAVGTTFEPGADLRVTAQNTALWAEPERQKVSQVRSILGSLIRESKVKVTGGPVTAASPTLEEAIRRLTESESATRQKLIVQKSSEAKTEGDVTLAQAEAKRVLDQAKAEAQRVIDEANEIKAQAERDAKLRQAQAKLEDVKTEVAVRDTLDEATRAKLRQRAADPSVQAMLAPLITPGYWTPAARSGGYREIEKKPMPFSEIKAAGALNRDSNGLKALVNIACNQKNDRPKWSDIVVRGLNFNSFLVDPQRMALAVERQKVLIEVAPVLVEMKLLEP